MNIYHYIHDNYIGNKKLLAVLIDPDDVEDIAAIISRLKVSPPDLLLVGGSILEKENFHEVVSELKLSNIAPVVLFPGDFSQISFEADGIFLLSLISGRNPEYLINQHVKAAMVLKDWGGEIIPTSYILIDGGKITTVQKVSQTVPLKQTDIGEIAATALAGQQLGHRVTYLEAGSGAKVHVNADIIKVVKSQLRVPIIVGGGIRDHNVALEIWQSGATVIVIGTAFEKETINLKDFISQRDFLNSK